MSDKTPTEDLERQQALRKRAATPQYGDCVRIVPDTAVIIRDPSTGAIVPPDGVVTTYSPFWARRVKEGAVIDHEPPLDDPAAWTTADGGPAPEGAEPTPTVSADEVAGATISPIPASRRGRHLLSTP